LSFLGDIARDDTGQSQLHAKVVVGKSDGSTCGGHFFEASVRPTMEVVVMESPRELRRRVRQDVGAALLDVKRW
jgi:predicted DNA-binding protein with PD1-like motif